MGPLKMNRPSVGLALVLALQLLIQPQAQAYQQLLSPSNSSEPMEAYGPAMMSASLTGDDLMASESSPGPQIQQRPFNPFIAAALNNMQYNQQPGPYNIRASGHHPAQHLPQVMHQPAQHQAHQLQSGQHPGQQQLHQAQPQPQPQHQQQQQQQHQPQPQPQLQLQQQQAPQVQTQQVSPSQQQPQPQQMVAASSEQHPMIASSSSMAPAGAWPLQAPDIPKIVNIEVKCEKNLMKVSVEFDKIFNGVIFSKGHFNQGQCLHVGQNSGKQQAYFDIGINTCGTQGNTQNGLYGMGGNTGSGTFFENTIVIQYDPNVQEVYDHARKLRCTWHDQYEKAVTFRPFPVDMLDIVRADFAGDNVGCWMQIQVGKGPWASEVAGIVKIGQTMTMVLAIKDEENKFDMLVRNCFAHDGKRGPIELVDKSGCITRPKLMSKFTKIKNFGSSATVLSYAHFQAFKFPDSMEVHFQCTIQICRHQCPEQCSAGPNAIGGPGESISESTISGTMSINGRDQSGAGSAGSPGAGSSDSVHLRKYGSAVLSRERRDLSRHHVSARNGSKLLPQSQTVGVNRVIQVVSTGDLAFSLQQQQPQQQQSDQIEGSTAAQLTRIQLQGQVCMSSYNFVLSLVVLSLVLLCSCLAAITLYLRHRSLMRANCPSSKLLMPASSPSPVHRAHLSHQHHHTIRSTQSHQVPTHTNHRHPNDHF